MKKKSCMAVSAWLLLALLGCSAGGRSPQKEGVVYLDPNAAPTAAATAADTAQEQAQAPADQAAEPASKEEQAALDLYFECRGVRIEPLMEAAPVLAALGAPNRTMEADSCAYVGKDVFYAYPGMELTVNQVEGVERITVITVADDTAAIPQGLRIYDEEERVLSLLGGTEQNGVYTYISGGTTLYVQVKEAEDGERRVWSMEYRATEEP